MKLLEYEGKELLKRAGVEAPKGVLVDGKSSGRKSGLKFPVMVKAQVLSGKRGKRGLIVKASNEKELEAVKKKLLGKEIDGEVISKLLVEEVIASKREWYLSITYSTGERGVVVLWSKQGGVDIEEQGGVSMLKLGCLNLKFKIPNSKLPKKIEKVTRQLLEAFTSQDLFLAEINPLVELEDGQMTALDAKITLDDAAAFRRQVKFADRNLLGKEKTENEVRAEKIDAVDHRGVAGRVYLDLEGDIGVVAAGGGASLVAMDALVAYGGKPANYTEFSGNPPAEKVKALTKIVLAKKGLRGCFLVGGKANFTDQYETLRGFMEALEEVRPLYPIVVRRDGPRIKEAFAMLRRESKKLGIKMALYDAGLPIVEAVKRGLELMG